MSNPAESGGDPSGATMRIGEADVVPTDGAAAPVSTGTMVIGELDVVAVSGEAELKSFGDYTVLNEIAAGGMGVVYLARQRSLNRLVALKMIRGGSLTGEEGVRRFRVEAEAAANLDHPNIVPIYELGEHEGRHYFSMKMVEGESLHDFNARGGARDLKWLRRVVSLMVKICRAVQHAHDRAILHRDLKPKNILIDATGEPLVTDFGLAKVLGQAATETMADAIMGTPHYMSPEQAAGRTRDVTTAADVYSLGAMLFELLTGRPPFVADTMMQVIVQVREAPAPNPAQLNPLVPPDLATICLKCLEKEPRHRYASAGVLAEEFERWIAGEPILARPATLTERAVKWVKRNPRLAFALGLALVSAVVAVAGITWQWQRAEKQSLERRRLGSRLEVQRAEDYFTVGNSPAALATLARVLRDDPASHVAAARLVNALNCREFLVPVTSMGAGATAASFVGTNAVLFTGTNAHGSVITLQRGHAAPRHFQPGPRQVLGARLSPDGLTLAAGSLDGLRIWNVRDGSLAGHWLTNQAVHYVGFVPGALGESVVAVASHSVLLIEVGGARSVRELAAGHPDVMLATQSENRRTIALATEAGHLLIRDLVDGADWLAVSNAHTAVIRALACGGDNGLVSGSADRTARIWDLRTGRAQATLPFPDTVLSAEFQPGGPLLVVSDRDGNVRLWDGRTREASGPVMKHPAAVNAARFSPDGRRIVTACDDGITRMWAVGDGRLLFQTLAERSAILDVAHSSDGRTILSVADGSSILVHAVLSGPGGRATYTDDASVSAIATAAKAPPAAEMATYAAGHRGEVNFADLSADGALAATASSDHTVRVWKRSTLEPFYAPLEHDALVNCARFSADGLLLATSTASGEVRVWDAPSGQPITERLRSREAVAQVWLTPDNAYVVTDERQLWPVYSARGPAPEWLPELGEAIAGVRLNERRVLETVPHGGVFALRTRLGAETSTNWLSNWVGKLLHELPAQTP